MDLRLPLAYERRVERRLSPSARNSTACRVIVVTMRCGRADIYRAIQSGAQSYLLKDMSKNEIVCTIRAVHAGGNPLSANVANRLAKRLQRQELNQRELEALHFLVKGHSNKEIAAKLFISVKTPLKPISKTCFTN